MSGDNRPQEIADATLEALRHTVGRNEHIPFLKQLIERQVGTVTFAEIADALVLLDVRGRDRSGWRSGPS